MSPYISRLRSILRYLGWADPIYKWKLSRGNCPVCGASLFISLKPSDFLTRCLSCKGNAVSLSLIPVIKKQFGGRAKTAHAYELSTYGATLCYLKNNFGLVTVSEYMPDEVNGAVINGVLNEDIQNLTFANDTFDLITSNSVLEHVPDDIKGLQECLRTLKSGGTLIFSVPLYGTPQTIKMAEVTPHGISLLEEAEFHDSRFGGPKSALTFWRHSHHDICDRVRAAGFNRVELVDVVLAPSQGLPTKVVYATKD